MQLFFLFSGRELLIGLESGKNESLKRLNKMTTVEQNEEAIRILRKFGLEPNVDFINSYNI
jgi:radical SAM superfamily enzyme YgiQ (UPF0313 family)